MVGGFQHKEKRYYLLRLGFRTGSSQGKTQEREVLCHHPAITQTTSQLGPRWDPRWVQSPVFAFPSLRRRP